MMNIIKKIAFFAFLSINIITVAVSQETAGGTILHDTLILKDFEAKEVVCDILKGESVEVFAGTEDFYSINDASSHWYLVIYNGNIGWVFGGDIELNVLAENTDRIINHNNENFQNSKEIITFELGNQEIKLNRSLFISEISESEVIEIYKTISGIWLPIETLELQASRFLEYSWGNVPLYPGSLRIDLYSEIGYGTLSLNYEALKIRKIDVIGNNKFKINSHPNDKYESFILKIDEIDNRHILSGDCFLFDNEYYYKVSGPDYDILMNE